MKITVVIDLGQLSDREMVLARNTVKQIEAEGKDLEEALKWKYKFEAKVTTILEE